MKTKFPYTEALVEIERLRKVLASIHAATDLKTARRRAYEGRTPTRKKDINYDCI